MLSDPVLNAVTIFVILCTGFMLRRSGIIDLASARRFTFVIMYITLPCAILSSARGLVFDSSLLAVLGISVAYNLLMLAVPFLGMKPSRYRMFCMFNLCGFNVGNFTLPFMQSMLTPQTFLALALFDLVNALFIFGGSYSIALWCNRRHMDGEFVGAGAIVRELAKSFPTYAYLIAIIFALAQIPLPDLLMRPVMTIGSANTFLCMMIIGTALSVNISLKELKNCLRLIAARYVTGAVLALIVWNLLPYSREIRIMLVVLALAPLASINSVMTLRRMPEYAGISADLISVTVLISLVVVTLVTTFA